MSHNDAGLLDAPNVVTFVSEEAAIAAGAVLALPVDFTPTFPSWRCHSVCFLGPAAVPTCRPEENTPDVVSPCAPMFSLLTCLEMHPNMDVTLPVTLQLLVVLLLLPLSHLPLSRSTSPHRGNCRPIRFEPPMLDFHEQ